MRLTRALLATAAACFLAAIFLPLWGMTLVSTQYPDGLRMVVYATRIIGDITELNVLNHYIGMIPISNSFFVELRILPALFILIALTCVLGAVVRRVWVRVIPLVAMLAVATYGFTTMHHRLWEFGHKLDPHAAIQITPFTPPMFGQNQIAQFSSYAWFGLGTYLPIIGGLLVIIAVLLDLRAMRNDRSSRPVVTRAPSGGPPVVPVAS